MVISPQLARFLDLIAFAEGTDPHPLTQNHGYDVIVSSVNGPEIFTDYSEHPFKNREANLVWRNPVLRSTASGRYQVLYRWWAIYKDRMRLPDFGPDSQDAVAIQQIREQRALHLVESGDIPNAIYRTANIWASFPGNNYGQGGKSLTALLSKYDALQARSMT